MSAATIARVFAMFWTSSGIRCARDRWFESALLQQGVTCEPHRDEAAPLIGNFYIPPLKSHELREGADVMSAALLVERRRRISSIILSGNRQKSFVGAAVAVSFAANPCSALNCCWPDRRAAI
jgi:hypothetical protein